MEQCRDGRSAPNMAPSRCCHIPLSRLAEYDRSATRPLLEACVAICQSCGHECERHAHYEHCRICEEACRRCEQACRELLDALK